MDGRAVALVLAFGGLTLGLIARYRDQRSRSRPAHPHLMIIAAPIAIIVGTLPAVLGLGERLSIAASILSILISITTIVLLVRHARRAAKS